MISESSEILLYRTDDGQVEIEVKLDHESQTIWLSQAQMAQLFDVGVNTINHHISSIYKEEELHEDRTIRYYRTVRREGSRSVERDVTHYNLKMILAVGYRVRSQRGTQFRKWATEHLNEYLVKGFLLNDKRLKNPDGAWDYFDEVLERIRDIRSSEKRFYQKVRDLFSQTSIDYDKKSEKAREFFATVQNKLIFAETGQTAAELIIDRADGDKPNMGLTAFEGSRVRKHDINIAKNYLSQEELSNLNRLVTMFLDFAEDRAKKREEINMNEWMDQTHKFLNLYDRNLLTDAGSKSRQQMEDYVEKQFKKFESHRKELEATLSEEEYLRDLKTTVKHIENQKEKQNGKK